MIALLIGGGDDEYSMRIIMKMMRIMVIMI